MAIFRGQKFTYVARHSTKSKNAAFESSIKINFESRCLIIYFFFGGGTKDLKKCLQMPFSKLISTVPGTAASSDVKYTNYNYQIMKPLYVTCGKLAFFALYKYII